MKLIIGVDFDNTIACYDQVFFKVACTLGMLKEGAVLSKSQVKEAILAQAKGDLKWQKLQGQVYGKYMNLASIFPGFVEFLYLAKLKGHSVTIVSHKSEYGHFDEEKIPLREAAMNWMLTKGLVETKSFSLNGDEVYFESTRELKVDKIRELGCNYYIDDLLEVFNEPHFPAYVEKILFDTSGNKLGENNLFLAKSWQQITKKIFNGWSESDLTTVAKENFPALNLNKAKLIKGRGNSRIYKLTGINSKKYALKMYPDRQLDSRPRLETEFLACKYFETIGFPVAKAFEKNIEMNWAIYEWISGASINTPDLDFIDDAIKFMRSLVEKSRSINEVNNFNEASEACLTGSEIVRQINSRFESLIQVDSIELTEYLETEYLPRLNCMIEQVKLQTNGFFDKKIPHKLQILSPSDFGAHNAIRSKSNQTIFIDFEYFGWDDPVKLVSDFYWHPGMNLSSELKERWLYCTKDMFKDDTTFELRLSAYLPLFALRWCLILLNEFLPDRLAQRMHARNQNSSDFKSVLSNQLDKSKTLLNQVIKGIPKYGSTLQTS